MNTAGFRERRLAIPELALRKKKVRWLHGKRRNEFVPYPPRNLVD